MTKRQILPIPLTILALTGAAIALTGCQQAPAPAPPATTVVETQAPPATTVVETPEPAPAPARVVVREDDDSRRREEDARKQQEEREDRDRRRPDPDHAR